MIFELFKDGRNQFRWRLKERNGVIIANSASDGHKRKRTCLVTYNKLKSAGIKLKDLTV